MTTTTAAVLDRFDGEVLTPGDVEYDERRRVFNGSIDRRPALIARCQSTRDVVAVLGHARDRGLPVSVHGGGHGVAGHAVCDGGVMIDLRGMKRVRVDPDARRAHVQAGLTWAELDGATQQHGLAVTGGRMSTTGVAGLTLGSGSGWVERKLGLTLDNLLSAEVVLATGKVVTASETEHPDLFWGLRGGGGNFGIVTSFAFSLHPVGPMLLGGMILHPGDRARDVLRFYREFISRAPDEIGGGVALVTAPHAPFVPEAARGRPAVAIIACYAGPVSDGERALAPLRVFGAPVLDMVAPMPYVELQKMLDPMSPAGLRNHWGADYYPSLDDQLIDGLCAAHASVPSPSSVILVVPGGGRIARVPEDAMALGQRAATFNAHQLAMWEDPADDERNITWLRSLRRATAPHATGRTSLNFLGEDGEDKVKAAFAPEKYERLVNIKRRYDPDNVFCLNRNIQPHPAMVADPN